MLVKKNGITREINPARKAKYIALGYTEVAPAVKFEPAPKKKGGEGK